MGSSGVGVVDELDIEKSLQVSTSVVNRGFEPECSEHRHRKPLGHTFKMQIPDQIWLGPRNLHF